MKRSNGGCLSTLLRFGRRARASANRSAANGPYRPRTGPPLRRTSRLTVEGARCSSAAMARMLSPCRSPSAIHSRSANDRYRADVERGRGTPNRFASCNHLVPWRRCTPTILDAVELSKPLRRAAQENHAHAASPPEISRSTRLSLEAVARTARTRGSASETPESSDGAGILRVASRSSALETKIVSIDLRPPCRDRQVPGRG